MLKTISAVVRHELRVVRRDIQPYVVMIIMPLLLMAFIKPAFARFDDAGNGSAQAVPGMVVMFSMFLVANVGIAFFREHGWGTWDRLRAMWVPSSAIMLGKAVAPLLVLTIQMAVLFIVGGFVFDLDVEGSIVGLGLITLAFAMTLVALGIALVSVCQSVMQLNSFANLLTLLLAGLGGALTPLSSLPDWARAVSPATPSYWAMRGYRMVIVDGASAVEVLPTSAMLIAFTCGFIAVVSWRFRFEETKTHWT